MGGNSSQFSRLASLASVGLALTACQAPETTRYAEYVEARPAISGEGSAIILSGDMIEIKGRRVRLFGVKAPDKGHTLLTNYALSVMHSIVDGKVIHCIERWTEEGDVLVAECGVVSPSGNGTGLNSLLLRSGASYMNIGDISRFPKGTFSSYQADQFAAQHQCLGVWKAAMSTPFTDPGDLAVPGC